MIETELFLAIWAVDWARRLRAEGEKNPCVGTACWSLIPAPTLHVSFNGSIKCRFFPSVNQCKRLQFSRVQYGHFCQHAMRNAG